MTTKRKKNARATTGQQNTKRARTAQAAEPEILQPGVAQPEAAPSEPAPEATAPADATRLDEPRPEATLPAVPQAKAAPPEGPQDPAHEATVAGAAEPSHALPQAEPQAEVEQIPTPTAATEVPQAEPPPAEPGSARVIADEPAAAQPQTPVAVPTKPKRGRKVKKPEPPQHVQEKKVSALDAAAKVLGETGQAMTCKELVAAMATKGYWTSPGGKTPEATLYSAVLRELQTKGEQARFVKAERGKFVLRTAG
jgi:hypothetical protein